MNDFTLAAACAQHALGDGQSLRTRPATWTRPASLRRRSETSDPLGLRARATPGSPGPVMAPLIGHLLATTSTSAENEGPPDRAEGR